MLFIKNPVMAKVSTTFIAIGALCWFTGLVAATEISPTLVNASMFLLIAVFIAGFAAYQYTTQRDDTFSFFAIGAIAGIGVLRDYPALAANDGATVATTNVAAAIAGGLILLATYGIGLQSRRARQATRAKTWQIRVIKDAPVGLFGRTEYALVPGATPGTVVPEPWDKFAITTPDHQEEARKCVALTGHTLVVD